MAQECTTHHTTASHLLLVNALHRNCSCHDMASACRLHTPRVSLRRHVCTPVLFAEQCDMVHTILLTTSSRNGSLVMVWSRHQLTLRSQWLLLLQPAGQLAPWPYLQSWLQPLPLRLRSPPAQPPAVVESPHPLRFRAAALMWPAQPAHPSSQQAS